MSALPESEIDWTVPGLLKLALQGERGLATVRNLNITYPVERLELLQSIWPSEGGNIPFARIMISIPRGTTFRSFYIYVIHERTHDRVSFRSTRESRAVYVPEMEEWISWWRHVTQFTLMVFKTYNISVRFVQRNRIDLPFFIGERVSEFESFHYSYKYDNGRTSCPTEGMPIFFEEIKTKKLVLGNGAPYAGTLDHERITLGLADWLKPHNIMQMKCQVLKAPHSHFQLLELNALIRQWQGNQHLKFLEMIQLGLTRDIDGEVRDPNVMFEGTGAELWHPPIRVLEKFEIYDIPLSKSWIIRREDRREDNTLITTMATVVFNNSFELYVWSDQVLKSYKDRINEEVEDSYAVKMLKETWPAVWQPQEMVDDPEPLLQEPTIKQEAVTPDPEPTVPQAQTVTPSLPVNPPVSTTPPSGAKPAKASTSTVAKQQTTPEASNQALEDNATLPEIQSSIQNDRPTVAKPQSTPEAPNQAPTNDVPLPESQRLIRRDPTPPQPVPDGPVSPNWPRILRAVYTYTLENINSFLTNGWWSRVCTAIDEAVTAEELNEQFFKTFEKVVPYLECSPEQRNKLIAKFYSQKRQELVTRCQENGKPAPDFLQVLQESLESNPSSSAANPPANPPQELARAPKRRQEEHPDAPSPRSLCNGSVAGPGPSTFTAQVQGAFPNAIVFAPVFMSNPPTQTYTFNINHVITHT